METDRKYRELEEKYWAGETNLIEDSAIAEGIKENPEFFSQELKSVFKAKSALTQAKLDDDFEREFWEKIDKEPNNKGFSIYHFIRYAAAGIMILGLAYVLTLLIQTDQSTSSTEVAEIEIVEDTYDSPEEAFKEAKKALMMASGKLNKGQEKIKEFKRFHDAKLTVMGAAEND
jgi:hypothetical protein